MKEIRMDWETYRKERDSWGKLGESSALSQVAEWLESGKSLDKFCEENRGVLLGRNNIWKRILAALGREDEFKTPQEE